MKLLIAILVALLLALQYRLWLGEGSFSEVAKLRQSVTEQERENDQLKARNQALEAEVQDLTRGLAAIEERARSELGMIKKGETFFQVIEPVASPLEHSPADAGIASDGQ
ncbi:MAG: cell division protein FtsB [Thiotrichales bacterium]